MSDTCPTRAARRSGRSIVARIRIARPFTALGRLLRRNAVALARPCAEVDQLAALGAEGAPLRLGRPRDRRAALGTLDHVWLLPRFHERRAIRPVPGSVEKRRGPADRLLRIHDARGRG